MGIVARSSVPLTNAEGRGAPWSGTFERATEVVPAVEGLTAADGVSAGGIGSGGSEGYLFHAASGLRLPGLEVFDPANVQAHLLPLVPVPVPEPSTLMLAQILLYVMLFISRSGASSD